MVLKVGLTGGIGSGKSTVAQLFETLGIPVYYADDAAKRLMNTDEQLKEVIQKNFGIETYKNNELDRKYLASIVFNDTYKLDLLNSIVHPATIHDSEEWIKDQKAPYIIREAALLFESGSAVSLDYVIGVYAPVNIRIKRAMERDNLNAEDIKKRIDRQIDEDIKMRLCDFVLRNDETELLIPQVIELHQKFISFIKA